MAENTGIEWADHTFNPWIGCDKVSPACDFCYAETFAKRTGQAHLWLGERRLTSDSNWGLPLRWNRQAATEARRFRVFCASLADVFDKKVPKAWRDRLWTLIRDTPHLDWLLLTKRPQLIARMLPEDWGTGYPNVWLGTTVEDMKRARQRLPALQRVPAQVHFVSAEPLLERLQLRRIPIARGIQFDALTGLYTAFTSMLGGFDKVQDALAALPMLPARLAPIDWVICGGESGPQARPMHPDGPRLLRDQCQSIGTAYLFKQWGEWVPYQPDPTSPAFWISQNGQMIDRHTIPDLATDEDPRAKYWSDACLYDGEEICLHLKVGKKLAGRTLDGRTWDEFPRVAA